MNTIRKAVVAGHFYPAEPAVLERELRRLVPPVGERRRVIGLLAPHAGYVYSGDCAGRGYAGVELTALLSKITRKKNRSQVQ